MKEGTAAIAAELVTREEGRRRALLLGIGALLLLSVGPVFGHHFASGLEHGLRGQDHLGPLCLIAMHGLLYPVHLAFHALVLGGVVYALYDRLRAAMRVRRTLGRVEAQAPAQGDPFWTAAAAVGLDPGRVRVVRGLPSPAFTVGWLRPRIYADRSLSERLQPKELEALLAHEGAHLDRRDPLRLSLLRFFALVLFWLPALRRLAEDVADEAEVQADDRAARGQPLALASAIVSLAGWRSPDRDVLHLVGFAQRADLLDRRVRRLAGEEPPPSSHVTRRSVAGALLALVLVWVSGAIMAHPLPTGADHHLLHCEHPGESPATHLFCFPQALRVEGDLCPHARRA
ncbi:MAG TPA: M56 family metallopeptidase [Longimicrobium sp.]|nr:M56 family metallopeptidase [Longimicrobium sp.]